MSNDRDSREDEGKDELSMIVYEASNQCPVAPLTSAEQLEDSEINQALTKLGGSSRYDPSVYGISHLDLEIPERPKLSDSRGKLERIADSIKMYFVPSSKSKLQKKIDEKNWRAKINADYEWACEVSEVIQEAYKQASDSYKSISDSYTDSRNLVEIIEKKIQELRNNALKCGLEIKSIEEGLKDSSIAGDLERNLGNSSAVSDVFNYLQKKKSELVAGISLIARKMQYLDFLGESYQNIMEASKVDLEAIDRNVARYQRDLVQLGVLTSTLQGLSKAELGMVKADAVLAKAEKCNEQIAGIITDINETFHTQLGSYALDESKEIIAPNPDFGRALMSGELSGSEERAFQERLDRSRQQSSQRKRLTEGGK